MKITLSDKRDIPIEAILTLYRANGWSAADKPQALYQALLNAHALITAWDQETLVGLGNALSDGYLMVYYPHLLVHPDYQGKGIGSRIVDRMQEIYGHLHMQMLTADGNAISFYEKKGFVRAGKTVPMWIYQGDEH